MAEWIAFAFYATAIGAGATALTDAWAWFQRCALGWPTLDYAMVGRWLGHLTRGRHRRRPVADAPPIAGERLLGWIVHYAIGIAYAAGLLGLWGLAWVGNPTLGPAVATGLVTVAAPFLVLQPALGAGIAASRTPRPGMARLKSVLTHLCFGLGLYLTAQLLRWLGAPG